MSAKNTDKNATKIPTPKTPHNNPKTTETHAKQKPVKYVAASDRCHLLK